MALQADTRSFEGFFFTLWSQIVTQNRREDRTHETCVSSLVWQRLKFSHSFCCIRLSPCRRRFGSAGVSVRKFRQPLESEGHPRHVWDGAVQGSLSLTFALLTFFLVFKQLYVLCLVWNDYIFRLKTRHVFRRSFARLMQIRSQAQFQDLCQQHVRGEAEGTSRSGCCPSGSLGNYLALLTNASCCLSLTSHQVV